MFLPQYVPPKQRLRILAMACTAYVIGFLFFDEASKLFDILPGVSLWYPASALSVLLIFLCGVYYAPVVFVANILSLLIIHHQPIGWVGVITSAIHTVCYSIAASWLRNVLADQQLRSVRATVQFVLVTLLAPLPIGLIASGALVLSGSLVQAEYGRVAFGWWLGDTIGVMVVMPLFLVHVAPRLRLLCEGSTPKPRNIRRSALECCQILLQALGIGVVLWVIFYSPLASQQVLFICFVPLVWVTLQNGISGATLAIWGLSFGAALAAANVGYPPNQIVRLQLLMVALALTGLALGAAITEQQQTARVMRNNEARIRAIMDSQLDLVCRYTLDTNLTFVNDAYCQFFGKSAEELIGTSFLPLTRPEHHDNIQRQIAHALATSEIVIDEAMIERYDGSLRWMQWLNRTIFDEHGRVTEIQVVGRDISDRRRAEQAYRSLVEQSLQGLAIIQHNRIAFANPAVCMMLGYTIDELKQLGDPRNLFHPDDQPILTQLTNGMLNPQTPHSAEVRARSRDGSYRWIQLFLVPTTYDGSEAIMAMALDTTARREAEAALQRSEDRYRIISELTSDYAYAYTLDANGEMQREWVAGAFTKICGYSVSELDERGGWETIVHPVDKAIMIERRAFLHQGIPYENELRIIRKDGEIRWLHIRIQPKLDEITRRLTAIYGAVCDITLQRQAEESQRAMDRRIQETQKLESIGLLAGGIAHDFNNLLVGVLGNAGMALAELPADSPVRETIYHIEMAANHGADLTRQLLAYAGKGRLMTRLIELNTLIEEMLQLLHLGIPRQVELIPRFTPEVLEITGDLTQIRQVLMNIVINAAEAIGQQAGVITITTGSRWFSRAELTDSAPTLDLEAGQYVTIEVQDTGVGMDGTTRARVFEPFFSTKQSGRGLGLAAVLGIVRSHHGTIQIESTPGHGSTFLVILPQAKQSDSDIHMSIPQQPKHWAYEHYSSSSGS